MQDTKRHAGVVVKKQTIVKAATPDLDRHCRTNLIFIHAKLCGGVKPHQVADVRFVGVLQQGGSLVAKEQHPHGIGRFLNERRDIAHSNYYIGVRSAGPVGEWKPIDTRNSNLACSMCVYIDEVSTFRELT